MTYNEQKIQEEFRKMKATGIVRRIDDLGRVVIPKEIRKTLLIKEGSAGTDYRTDCLYYRS